MIHVARHLIRLSWLSLYFLPAAVCNQEPAVVPAGASLPAWHRVALAGPLLSTPSPQRKLERKRRQGNGVLGFFLPTLAMLAMARPLPHSRLRTQVSPSRTARLFASISLDLPRFASICLDLPRFASICSMCLYLLYVRLSRARRLGLGSGLGLAQACRTDGGGCPIL